MNGKQELDAATERARVAREKAGQRDPKFIPKETASKTATPPEAVAETPGKTERVKGEREIPPDAYGRELYHRKRLPDF